MRPLTKRYLFTALSTFFILSVAFSAASAQWNTGQRYDNNYALSVATRLQNNSSRFRSDFRREVNNMDLSRAERNRYNNYVSKLESDIKKLRSELSRNRDSQKQAQDVMNSARDVNSTVNNNYFPSNVSSQWNTMRNDLNQIGSMFGLGNLDGGGSGGGPGQGGGMVRPPNWAIGTFTGRNTSNQNVTLTVANGGQVTLNEGGQTLSGYFMPSNNMNIQGVIYRILQQGNNVAITNMSAGRTVNLSRGGGWGGNPGNPGNQDANVPRWAIGTWYGNDPQTGGEWSLTINQNGTVVYAFASGATQQGTIHGDRIAILGVEYRVSQISGGLRTTNTSNGSRIDFRSRR